MPKSRLSTTLFCKNGSILNFWQKVVEKLQILAFRKRDFLDTFRGESERESAIFVLASSKRYFYLSLFLSKNLSALFGHAHFI